MSKLILLNGISIPSIGMGTFPLHGIAMDIAIDAALSCGYRAFDTAYGYNNDDSLGNSLQKHISNYGLTRKDIFITTKIGDKLIQGRPTGMFFYNSYSCSNRNIKDIVEKQLKSSLNHLHTDYIDLLLLHYPYPDYYPEIWHCMETLYLEGKVRAIGVSNFRERHLDKIIDTSTIKPMINQIEHHPLNTREKLVKYCKKLNMLIEASSPLLMMNRKLIKSELLSSLSIKYSKSIPQIILRWDIQLGIIPIPKSSNKFRLKENIDIYDFELTNEEVHKISALNENFTMLPESLYCPGY